jgi:HEPN domain-containing protein
MPRADKYRRKGFRRKNADGHFNAARSHIEEARLLYSDGRYGYSIYTAGLAVECMFGAFILRDNPQHAFDEKHDLQKLMKRSKLLELSNIDRKRILNDAYNFVYNYWSNLYRFASDDEIERTINKKKFKKVQGYLFKYVALQIYENAMEIIKRGERKGKALGWIKSEKK